MSSDQKHLAAKVGKRFRTIDDITPLSLRLLLLSVMASDRDRQMTIEELAGKISEKFRIDISNLSGNARDNFRNRMYRALKELEHYEFIRTIKVTTPLNTKKNTYQYAWI